MTNYKLLNFTLAAILLTLFIMLLYFGHSLLIPFVIAIVIWYLIISFVESLEKIPYIGKYLPKIICYVLAVVLAFAFFYFLVNLMTKNITELIDLIPTYQNRFFTLQKEFLDFFHIKKQPDFSKYFEKFNFYTILSSTAGIMADLGRNLFLILIYVLFLLLEHGSFQLKLSYMIKDPKRQESAKNIISKITRQIRSYLKIKASMGLLTAISSYLIMLTVGVNFADFWAVLIFIFNFIPNIGSIIATLLPCLLTLVQFDTLIPFFIVGISLIAIQFTIGNIVEPKLMGRSFNLSPLAIIVFLSFWGYLWGIVGMLLCVPMMVIITIVMANFQETRGVSILLSATGDIEA